MRVALSKRVLFSGVLHALAHDPPRQATKVLQQLSQSVLAPQAGVPPRLQAAIFGDGALEQLCMITARTVGEDEAAKEVVSVAHALLMRLCTDPAHGLCPALDGGETEKKTQLAMTTVGKP